jgi:hypothetical protein
MRPTHRRYRFTTTPTRTAGITVYFHLVWACPFRLFVIPAVVGLLGQVHTRTESANLQRETRICLVDTERAYVPRA